MRGDRRRATPLGADYGEVVKRAVRCWFVMALFITGLALAGCTQTGSRAHVSGTGAAVAGEPSATATAEPAADGVQQVVIDTTDENHFKPDTVLAHPGKLRITLTNPSVFPVDLAIPTLNVHSSTVFAGDTSVIEVNIPATGEYSFVCTFHEHEGMTGTLIVS